MTISSGMTPDVAMIDTNVLIYAYDASEVGKHETATRLVDRLIRDERGVLSVQVLNEFFGAPRAR